MSSAKQRGGSVDILSILSEIIIVTVHMCCVVCSMHAVLCSGLCRSVRLMKVVNVQHAVQYIYL